MIESLEAFIDRTIQERQQKREEALVRRQRFRDEWIPRRDWIRSLFNQAVTHLRQVGGFKQLAHTENGAVSFTLSEDRKGGAPEFLLRFEGRVEKLQVVMIQTGEDEVEFPLDRLTDEEVDYHFRKFLAAAIEA